MHSTTATVVAPRTRPALRRPRACAVSGTSAALANHLGWPLPAVRGAFGLLALLWGAGVLLYAWIWALTPFEESDAAPTRRVPVAWILTALSGLGALVVLGTLVGGGSETPLVWPGWYPWVTASALLAVGAGLWATLADRVDPTRGPRHEMTVRLSVTGILVALVISQLAVMAHAGVAAFLLAVAILAGIALVYSSTLIGKWRELSGERIRRIREEQRSEMAAHLHDSVLQTLALIQNRAGASSEVARLARAQERELRSWLYDGDTPADSDLPTDLRDFAGALELDYPVRIEVVSAGLSTERASGDVAAAAREAMLNAARHAGGDVSVYIEGAASGVDVFVRDRGPGFSLATVPGDRLGVRESIVGRLRRAGGTATVKPGAGGVGTEVHLHLTGEEPRRG
jgi:phage shock protein PspC (stress-responsive transcriptional regulator)